MFHHFSIFYCTVCFFITVVRTTAVQDVPMGKDFPCYKAYVHVEALNKRPVTDLCILNNVRIKMHLEPNATYGPLAASLMLILCNNVL